MIPEASSVSDIRSAVTFNQVRDRKVCCFFAPFEKSKSSVAQGTVEGHFIRVLDTVILLRSIINIISS